MNLKTPRLVLHELGEADLDDLYAFYGDARFQRYEHPGMSRDEVQADLLKTIQDQQAVPRTHFRLGVTAPPDTLVGTVILLQMAAHIQEWEIGWGIHPAYWGQGLATEAAGRMLELAFSEMGANRVVAFCHIDNAASWRVMEKLGMQREGCLRQTRWLNGERCNELVYSILRQDWVASA